MNSLIWGHHKQWLQPVECLIRRFCGDEFILRIAKNKVYPILGDLSWFENNLNLHKNHYDSLMLDLINGIKKSWSHIRLYHACRPENIDDYYVKGIVPSSIEALDEYVINTLQEHANIEDISNVLKYMHRFYNKSDEKVFVAFDKEHLETFCDHHLMYGSEYLLCAALLLGTLNNKISYILSTIYNPSSSIPIIFHCDIPIEFIPAKIIYEISLILIVESFRTLMFQSYIPSSKRFGFGISKSIRPDWIIDFTIPIINKEKCYPSIWMDLNRFEKEFRQSKIYT